MAATITMTIRCDAEGCEAGKQIELKLELKLDANFDWTRMPGIGGWLPDGWTQDYSGNLFCPAHEPKGRGRVRVDEDGDAVFLEAEQQK